MLKSKSGNLMTETQNHQINLLNINNNLQSAYELLSGQQFQIIMIKTIKKCFKKAQVQHMEQIFMPYIHKWLAKYNPTVELLVLEILMLVRNSMENHTQQAFQLLVRAKHMVLGSEYQYLLSKIFLTEAKIHQIFGQQTKHFNCLKKCIEYTEKYVFQYLKEQKQIRGQIADNMIIAYFQLYKLKRENKSNYSLQMLQKSYKTALRNYGQNSQSAKKLKNIYNYQVNIKKNLQKFQTSRSNQVITIIGQFQNKGYFITAIYYWQEEKIKIQMCKRNGIDKKLVSQDSCYIKLRMCNIKQLKNLQWIYIEHGEVSILEQILMNLISTTKTTNAIKTLNSIPRAHLITKDQISSSSDQEEIRLNLIKRIGNSQIISRQNL